MTWQENDLWNPSEEVIRHWAADADSFGPQDWDLEIVTMGYEDLFIELVEDVNCPKADFFLHCLYLWVYQTLLSSGPTEEFERLIRRGEVSVESALRIWARRSRNLVVNREREQRHLWWQFGQNRTDR